MFTCEVCDFGLSDFYVDPQNNAHIPLTKGHSRYGTVRYASLNNHRGIEQSRRDDLESLGFVLIYAAKGNVNFFILFKARISVFLKLICFFNKSLWHIFEVPWQTIRNEDRRKKWSQVYEMKRRLKLSDLCDGLPDCFKTFMENVILFS